MPTELQTNDADGNRATANACHVKSPTGPFQHLPDALPVLRDFEVRQKLLQWNLSDTLQLKRFRVHRKLSIDGDEALLAEFFQDEGVHQVLSLPSALSSSSPASEEIATKEDKTSAVSASMLRFERLRTSVTSMAFFEKLQTAGVVSRDGSVRGCMDEDFDGCTAGDLLTELLANPESENADVFSREEQREFIFHLFRTLVVGGGALRQADDRLQAYEDITRAFYRALLSVKKGAGPEGRRGIEISSRVYRVSGSALFQPSPSRFHSCFAVLDAHKRWLTVWYCPFSASW